MKLAAVLTYVHNAFGTQSFGHFTGQGEIGTRMQSKTKGFYYPEELLKLHPLEK
ncbi:MAG: hypothetical protein U5K54_19550 [Cytophagales bacterium]|nr:hypothetical protein [Cytophagales bacterium]